MTSATAAGGSLAPATLVRLLGRFYRERATGVLVVEHDGKLSRGYFRNGFPAGVNVFANFKPLGRFLLDIGWIDFETLNRSLEEVAKTQRPQGEILVELGALTREKLALGLRRQLLANLAELLLIETGSWRFDTDGLPPWTEDLAVSPHEAVLRFLLDAGSAPRVAAILAALGDGPLVLAPEFERERKRFDLASADQQALAGFRSPTPLASVRQGARLPDGRLEAVVAALSVFALVTGAEAPAGGAGPATGGTPPAGGTGEAEGAQAGAAAGREARTGDAKAGGSGAAPSDVRARRSRLLRRAFQNIPGAQVMNQARRPEPATPAPAGDAGGGQKATPAPDAPDAPEAQAAASTRDRAAEAEARALLREIDARHAAIAKEDFYRRLGLTSSAPLPKVKAAYLILAKKYHPDRVGALGLPDGSAEKLRAVFEAVHEAYETLVDPKARAEYDKLLANAKVKGDRDQARRLAEANIQFKKGEALFRKKDYAQALAYLEPASKMDPENGLYLVTLAWAKYTAGPAARVKDEVILMLQRATRLEGAKDRAWYHLGLLARMDDRVDDAVRFFESAVKLNKHLNEAVSELRVIRRRLEKQADSSTGRFFKKMLGKD